MGAKSSRKSEKAHMEMYFLDEKIALDLLFVFAAKMGMRYFFPPKILKISEKRTKSTPKSTHVLFDISRIIAPFFSLFGQFDHLTSKISVVSVLFRALPPARLKRKTGQIQRSARSSVYLFFWPESV